MLRKFRNITSISRQLAGIQKKHFSWFNRIKRHFDVMLEPSSWESTSALQDTNTALYTNMRQFQAYLTKNAYDMSVNNEYDLWPHTNFGTIDNPLLVFSAGTTWRMVICSGPGNDEESSFHEKMYFIVREGPIHRCIMCGQCFKLQVLKDSIVDPDNIYYSIVFTDVSPRSVSEPELAPYALNVFVQHDYNQNQYNILPTNRAYLMVNNDEGDHLMVDPAYRMEKYKEADEYFRRSEMVIREVARQKQMILDATDMKSTIAKEVYERWFEVEHAILKYDRMFNRYEKFVGRAFFDPENHERREKRMQERIAFRNNDNYTYYFNGLTEFEQNYRDYYESDVEELGENEHQFEQNDLENLRSTGDFDFKRWEFEESSVYSNFTNAIDDIIGRRLFRYKYRSVNDPKFVQRNQRVLSRYLERAKNRDPNVTSQLGETLEKYYVQNSVPFKISDLLTGNNSNTATDELLPYMKYVADEGVQQYLDYYESDTEEQPFFEHVNNLNQRDRLRFAEHFENFHNKAIEMDKYYVTIPKRPYDNTKSIFANFVTDLIDFNNRVRPIARSLAFRDVSLKHQILPSNEQEARLESNDRYRKLLNFSKTGPNHLDEVNRGSK